MDQRAPRTNYRKDSSMTWKGSALEESTQVRVQETMMANWRGRIKKNCTIISFLIKSVWNPIADVSEEVQFVKTSIWKLTRILMELILINNTTILTNTVNNTISVSNFPHFCLNNNWAPVQDLYASQKVQVFSGRHRLETLFWHEQGKNEQVH